MPEEITSWVADQTEGVPPHVKFLGLAGKAGAGKDFLREWLCERSSLDVLRVGWADRLREEVRETLGLSCDQAQALFTKPYPYEVRRLLQWWGTDLRRADDEDYWVRRGVEFAVTLAHRCPVPTLIVFTDTRFENEQKAIEQLGGKVFEVIAPAEVREARTGMKVPDHASEEIDFKIDGFVFNRADGEDPLIPPEFVGWLGLK